MRTAFVYAGQGSQKVHMGVDLYEAYPEFRAAFDMVDGDGHILALCRNATDDKLADTRNTQPVMVACAIASTALLESRGIRPEMVAGLSLGEYPALVAARALEPVEAVRLACFRGVVMQEAIGDRTCGMCAVMGLDGKTLADVCRDASAFGVVEPTNYNCPGQIVISGDAAAVDEASRLALEAGARRCVPLPVSGAFHTSLMKPAGDALRERLAHVEFTQPEIPVIFNVTARPLGKDETIAGLLERQVQNSVRFEESVRYMEATGIDTILEIGPGTTLSKFVHRISKDIRTFNVGDIESFEKTVSELSRMSAEDATSTAPEHVVPREGTRDTTHKGEDA